jgi:hypothetical protein
VNKTVEAGLERAVKGGAAELERARCQRWWRGMRRRDEGGDCFSARESLSKEGADG